MKRIANILTVILLSSLVVFVACKKKKKSDPDPLDVQAAKLTAVTGWKPAAAANVTKGGNQNGDWSNFTISFQYNNDTDQGQYTIAGIPTNDGADEVWGANGSYSWAFEGSNTDVIVRADAVRVTVNVDNTSTSLILTFTIADSSGRVAGFDGDWRFELVPQ